MTDTKMSAHRAAEIIAAAEPVFALIGEAVAVLRASHEEQVFRAAELEGQLATAQRFGTAAWGSIEFSPSPVGLARVIDALMLLDQYGCTTYTRGRCSDANSGRTRESTFGAESWCEACIAADALAALRSDTVAATADSDISVVVSAPDTDGAGSPLPGELFIATALHDPSGLSASAKATTRLAAMDEAISRVREYVESETYES